MKKGNMLLMLLVVMLMFAPICESKDNIDYMEIMEDPITRITSNNDHAVYCLTTFTLEYVSRDIIIEENITDTLLIITNWDIEPCSIFWTWNKLPPVKDMWG